MSSPPPTFPSGHPDERWMKEAIRVAHVSRERGDYAFGAVLVRDGHIVTASGNKVVTYRDPTGHAELNCLRKAALREGHRHLRPVPSPNDRRPLARPSVGVGGESEA